MPAVEAPAIDEIAASQVQARRERGEGFLLLDVREAAEREKARIEGATWIPLGELAARLDELDAWRERPVVVHCHHGGRSLRAARALRERGFAQVANLTGGIDAWSLTVDPSVPRY